MLEKGSWKEKEESAPLFLNRMQRGYLSRFPEFQEEIGESKIINKHFLPVIRSHGF
jgi:hypothetical protein